MQILVIAAGSGKRFSDAGYLVPKPFIPVAGKPMLQRVLDMINMAGAPEPVLVARREHEYHLESFGIDRIVYVDHPQTDGAAMSVLCAMGVLNDEEPVIVVNCDNVVPPDTFALFYREACRLAEKGEGLILTMHVDGGPWSYVRRTMIHGQEFVASVVEKKPISKEATCGFYAFPSWRALRNSIFRMVVSDNRTNGEYYLAPAYSHVRFRTRTMEIPRNLFTSLGTPADVEAYNAIAAS